MTNPSVTETWATAIAAELHRIADDFAKVDTVGGLPEPRSVALSIQPGGPHRAADDEVIGTVDTIGRALFGTTGQIQDMSDGTFHYKVEGKFGAVAVTAFREISAVRVEQTRAGAVLAEKEAELAKLRAEVEKLRAEVEKLRAEVEKLRAEASGLSYTRADDGPDDPTPVSGGRIELHTGGVTEGGLVDETAAEPVHAEFSTGESSCGLATVPTGAGSSDWNKVTCKACIDEMPF
jgi:hypothetical protein